MKFVSLDRYRPPLSNSIETATSKNAYSLWKRWNKPKLLVKKRLHINRHGDTSKSPLIGPIFGISEFFEVHYTYQPGFCPMIRCCCTTIFLFTATSGGCARTPPTTTSSFIPNNEIISPFRIPPPSITYSMMLLLAAKTLTMCTSHAICWTQHERTNNCMESEWGNIRFQIRFIIFHSFHIHSLGFFLCFLRNSS